jgi:hypothetical protein
MQKSLEKIDQHELSSILSSLYGILPQEHAPFDEKGSTQMNLDLGHEHLGREIWGNTVVHGENHVEERNPHTERSVNQ